MNRWATETAALLTALALAGSAWAQAGSAWAQAASGQGEVQRVDKAQGRITLKHGAIQGLDLPPMTLVYRVSDARLLETVAAGDTVRFSAEKRDGQYTVTSIVKAP